MNLGKEPVPIGVRDFRLMASSPHYIDKTGFIADVCKCPGCVIAYHRPDGFGKSLALSMLECFFSMDEDSRSYFKGKAIAKLNGGVCMEEMNAYPTIHLDLSALDAPDYPSMMEYVANMMASAYEKANVSSFKSIWEYDRKSIKAILSKAANEVELEFSLQRLSMYLKEETGKRAVILIDGYDAPVIAGAKHGYAKEAGGFFQAFFGAALKGNEAMERGVLVGVVPIIYASDFSGFNNLIYRFGYDDIGEERFAFTRKETMDYLRLYDKNFEEKMVQEWYGGYRLSNQESFCPRSILAFANGDFEFKSYKESSSIDPLLLRNEDPAEVVQCVEGLISGKPTVCLTPTTIGPDSIAEQPKFRELSLYSGYFTVDDIDTREYHLFTRIKIPNIESRKALEKNVLGALMITPQTASKAKRQKPSSKATKKAA